MSEEQNLEADTADIVEANPWEVTSVDNPVWFDAEHTVIKCTVSFAGGDPVEGYAVCSYDPEEHGRELFAAIVSRKYGRIDDYVPKPVVTVLPAVTLWQRMTNEEAEHVNAAMATQPFRTRQIFMTANTFRSDHELWPLLVQMATDLFGESRANELLSV